MKDTFNFFGKVWNWLSTDGLLHIFVCWILMMVLQPLIGWVWSIILTSIISILKECYDMFFQKDNNIKQALHDLFCDVIGIMLGTIYLLLFY